MIRRILLSLLVLVVVFLFRGRVVKAYYWCPGGSNSGSFQCDYCTADYYDPYYVNPDGSLGNEYYSCHSQTCTGTYACGITVNNTCASVRTNGATCTGGGWGGCHFWFESGDHYVGSCAGPYCTPDNSCQNSTCASTTCWNGCSNVTGTVTCSGGQVCSSGTCSCPGSSCLVNGQCTASSCSSWGSCSSGCGNHSQTRTEVCGGCGGVLSQGCGTCTECQSCTRQCGQAKDCGGNCAQGNECTNPLAPTNPIPNNATNSPLIMGNPNITLQWGDPSNIASPYNFDNFVVRADGAVVGTLPNSQHSLLFPSSGGMVGNHKYSWTVQTYKAANCNGLGCGANGYSPAVGGYFCYQVIPGAPSMVNGNGGSASSPYGFANTTTANLTWNLDETNHSTTTQYEVQVLDSSGSTILASTTTTNATINSYSFTGSKGTVYSWRVRALTTSCTGTALQGPWTTGYFILATSPILGDFNLYSVTDAINNGYRDGSVVIPQNTSIGFSGNQICQYPFQMSTHPRSVSFRVGVVDNDGVDKLSEIKMRLVNRSNGAVYTTVSLTGLQFGLQPPGCLISGQVCANAGGQPLGACCQGTSCVVANPGAEGFCQGTATTSLISANPYSSTPNVGLTFYETPHAIMVGTTEVQAIFPLTFPDNFNPLNYEINVWAVNKYGLTMVNGGGASPVPPATTCTGIKYYLSPASPENPNTAMNVNIDRNDATSCSNNWQDVGLLLDGAPMPGGAMGYLDGSKPGDGYHWPINSGRVGNHTIQFTINNGACSCNPSYFSTVTPLTVDGWVDTNQTFKSWSCTVAVTGDVYDASAYTYTDLTSCLSTIYTSSNPSNLYNRNPSLFKELVWQQQGTSSRTSTTISNISHYVVNVGLTWGYQYLPLFNADSDMPGLNQHMRVSDKGTNGGPSPITNLCWAANGFSPSVLDLRGVVVNQGGQFVVNPYADNPSAQVDFAGIRNQDPWFQAVGGGVQSDGVLHSAVPVTCSVSNNSTPGSCLPALSISKVGSSDSGIVTGKKGMTNTNGCATNQCFNGYPSPERNWSMNGTNISTVPIIDYNKLMNQLYFQSGIGATLMFDSNPSANTQAWQKIKTDANYAHQVLFIDTLGQGLTISSDLSLPANADAYSVIVVNGDMTIEPTVSRLDGIYVATGTMTIGGKSPTDNQLVINGSLFAQRLVLTRSFTTASLNNTQPAIQVNYQPGYLILLPQKVFKNMGAWSQGSQ